MFAIQSTEEELNELMVYYWPNGLWMSKREFEEIPDDFKVSGYKRYKFDVYANAADIQEKIDHLVSVQGWF